MTTNDSTDWWPVLLDGALGSIVGTVASVAIALIVIKRQLKSERSMAREERRHVAAVNLLTICDELAAQRQTLLRRFEDAYPDAPDGWDESVHAMCRREQFGLPLAIAAGGAIARSYRLMNSGMVALWLMANEPEFTEAPDVLVALFSLAEPIDDVLGAIRGHLEASAAD